MAAHQAELGGVLGLEAQGIEANVARVVRLLEEVARDILALVRVGPADLDANALGDADRERHAKPKRRREGRDLLDGRAAVAREQGVEELLDQEASGSEHADAAVG